MHSTLNHASNSMLGSHYKTEQVQKQACIACNMLIDPASFEFAWFQAALWRVAGAAAAAGPAILPEADGTPL